MQLAKKTPKGTIHTWYTDDGFGMAILRTGEELLTFEYNRNKHKLVLKINNEYAKKHDIEVIGL